MAPGHGEPLLKVGGARRRGPRGRTCRARRGVWVCPPTGVELGDVAASIEDAALAEMGSWFGGGGVESG